MSGTAFALGSDAVTESSAVVAVLRYGITEINQYDIVVPREVVEWLKLAVKEAPLAHMPPVAARPCYAASEAVDWIKKAERRCYQLQFSRDQPVKLISCEVTTEDTCKLQIVLGFDGRSWNFYGSRTEFCLFAGTAKK